MVRIAHCAPVLAGLLLGGCASDHQAPSATQTAYVSPDRSDRMVAQGPGRGANPVEPAPTTRPDQMLGYTIAPESRYDVTLDDIRGYVQNNAAVIVDARSPAAFGRGHLRGAINLPAGQTDAYFQPFSQSVSPDQLIILYCKGPHCDSADMVYEYLAARGYHNMRVFRPGWETLNSAADLR